MSTRQSRRQTRVWPMLKFDSTHTASSSRQSAHPSTVTPASSAHTARNLGKACLIARRRWTPLNPLHKRIFPPALFWPPKADARPPATTDGAKS
jgi:hypothetical protein